MNRRTALIQMSAMAAGLATGVPGRALAQVATTPQYGPGALLSAPWAAWKAAFLADDGRVVDALQDGASHSESQGYGLYMAALFGDDAAFNAIFNWTELNLAIRSDSLLAWRWLPNSSSQVPDRNNASDGDLFYAWGLVIRGQRDSNPVYMDRARDIATDLVKTCVTRAPDGSGQLVFMPAAQGFSNDQGLVINPSYYMPLAMRDVARATGATELAICAADGVRMMRSMAVSNLIPDWVELRPQGMYAPASRPDRNGYEAIRVPLYLIWSGDASHPAVTNQARAYRQFAGMPKSSDAKGGFVTVFERSSGSVVETSQHVGYAAVAALVDCASTNQFGSTIPIYRTAEQAYYPATLHLMSLIAQITASPECVPI